MASILIQASVDGGPGDRGHGGKGFRGPSRLESEKPNLTFETPGPISAPFSLRAFVRMGSYTQIPDAIKNYRFGSLPPEIRLRSYL